MSLFFQNRMGKTRELKYYSGESVESVLLRNRIPITSVISTVDEKPISEYAVIDDEKDYKITVRNDLSAVTFVNDYIYCSVGSNFSFSYFDSEDSYGSTFFKYKDDKRTLDLSDDAASVNWGGSWRMPTDVEWFELIINSTWTWTSQGGVYGCLVTSTINGNSIFLPAAGFQFDKELTLAGARGRYWCSSLNPASPYRAYYGGFHLGEVIRGSDARWLGFSVRPVTE